MSICRYIHGDPLKPGWCFCHHEALKGTSWCNEHLKIVFQRHKKLNELDEKRRLEFQEYKRTHAKVVVSGFNMRLPAESLILSIDSTV